MFIFDAFLLWCLNIISPPKTTRRYSTSYSTVEEQTTNAFYLGATVFAPGGNRETTRVNEEYNEGNPDW